MANDRRVQDLLEPRRDGHFFGACNGKLRHPSKGRANAEIRRMKKMQRDDPEVERLEAYKCRFCRNWHVGHNRRGRRKAMAAGAGL